MVNGADESNVLRIDRRGQICVVGFNSRDFLDVETFTALQSELRQLIDETKCETLVIDLDGTERLPSGVFGFFASLIGLGVELKISNASDHIISILRTTRLHERIQVCDDLAQFRH